MRNLIEEYGQLMITLIVASAVLVVIIMGIALPQLKAHAESTIPSIAFGTPPDYIAAKTAITRPAPVLTVPTFEITTDESLSFQEQIANGVIKATNYDGASLNDKISITPFDVITASFYDENTRVFQGAPEGEYKFILSVKDIVGEIYYGKEVQIAVVVAVVASET